MPGDCFPLKSHEQTKEEFAIQEQIKQLTDRVKEVTLPAPAYEWRFRLKDGRIITGCPKIDDYLEDIHQIYLLSNRQDRPWVTLIVNPGEVPYRSTQTSLNMTNGEAYEQQILGIKRQGMALYAIVDQEGNIYLSSSKDI
jgi:hypothetical protein